MYPVILSALFHFLTLTLHLVTNPTLPQSIKDKSRWRDRHQFISKSPINVCPVRPLPSSLRPYPVTKARNNDNFAKLYNMLYVCEVIQLIHMYNEFEESLFC